MLINFFCLDCEKDHVYDGYDADKCPHCDSENIVEDTSINDYEDGHFEGDMYFREHNNSVGDD